MRFYKSEKGFTVTELMVVLVILVALTILVLAGYSESFPRLGVERATESFISDLYRVRERTLSSLSYDEDIKEPSHGIFMEEGEGYYEILFGEGDVLETVETVDIDRGVVIRELLLESVSTEELKVVFTKKGEVLFADSSGELSEIDGDVVVSFVSEGDEDLERSVSINSKGVAEIKYE